MASPGSNRLNRQLICWQKSKQTSIETDHSTTLKDRQPSSDCRYHPQKSKQWGTFFVILFSQTTGLVMDKKNPKVFKIPLDLVPLIVSEML